MSEKIAYKAPETDHLSHEQLAEDVIARARTVIEKANKQKYVNDAHVGANYLTWFRHEVGQSGAFGDDIVYDTSYSAALDEQGGVELRLDEKAYRPLAKKWDPKVSEGSVGYESLLINSDGSMKFSEYSGEDTGRNARGSVRTEADMKADQMQSFSDGVFKILEDAIEKSA